MLQIGLMGARGSGKSELAQALAPELNATIIDGYIEKFQDQTNLAVGQYATYIVNMQIAMFRLNHELAAKEDATITCGTLLETTIYLAMNAANMAGQAEGDFSTNLFNDMRANGTMQWFGMCRLDAWRYDKVFYLPLGDKRDEESDMVAAVIDDHIKEACEAFKIEYVELTGNLEEKKQYALNEIENRLPVGESTTP